MAHKCRTALLGRRAYLFNVWKMRKEKGHRRPRWTAGLLLRMLCPWSRPPEAEQIPQIKVEKCPWRPPVWSICEAAEAEADVAGKCQRRGLCSYLMTSWGLGEKTEQFWPGPRRSSCSHFLEPPRDCWPADVITVVLVPRDKQAMPLGAKSLHALPVGPQSPHRAEQTVFIIRG